MKQYRLPDFKRTMSSDEVVGMTLAILRIHYERQLERYQQIITGFDDLYELKLCGLWDTLVIHSDSPQDAFPVFVRIIESELDGGDCPNHHTSTIPPHRNF